MEVTKWAEALWCQRAALGGSATMRARTRVNAEQASKHLTREPTLSQLGGRPTAGWEESVTGTDPRPPG